jgi:NAD(P)-dependent dehydrogenase (short-subunit alcohol dehydrogenase family)
MKKDVIVVIGAGLIGQAIARRVGVAKHVLLGRHAPRQRASGGRCPGKRRIRRERRDRSTCRRARPCMRWWRQRRPSAISPGSSMLPASRPVRPPPPRSSRSTCTARRSSSRSSGTSSPAEGPGGHCVAVRASPAGAHRSRTRRWPRRPVEELLGLPFLQADQVTDSLHAYQLAKRGNSLRVMAEALRWAKRGARVNTISPGIIMTPLAKDELSGPRAEGYRRMIELSPAGRAGTPDEVGKCRRAAHGPGRRVHHRQRLPHGRRRDRRLLVRRPRTAVSEPTLLGPARTLGQGLVADADTSRLETFSDGVLAIVITLLVLGIEVPPSSASLGHDLLALWPSYLAYGVSFLLIGAIWVNHHAMFRHIVRADGTLLVLNLLHLMVVAFMPFSTAVLAQAFLRGTDEPIAAAFYGAVLAVGRGLRQFHVAIRSPRTSPARTGCHRGQDPLHQPPLPRWPRDLPDRDDRRAGGAVASPRPVRGTDRLLPIPARPRREGPARWQQHARRHLMEIRAKQATSKAPAETFVGDAWYDVIARGEEPSRVRVNVVRFAPGARNAWHAHAVGQTVHVTEGIGRIQARGGGGPRDPPRRHRDDAGRRVALARRRAGPLHDPPRGLGSAGIGA